MHKIARANNPRRFLIFLKVVNCIKSYQKFGAGDFVFSQYDKKLWTVDCQATHTLNTD